MKLTGARVAFSAISAKKLDIWVSGGRVSFLPKANSQKPELDLAGYMILPGLINSHDHLELNLFPKLGNGTYANANAWAKDIYRPANFPIKEHLAVPKSSRLRWGAIKNLLSGATTVAHHNPLPLPSLRRRLPIRILPRYGWAHSLYFSPDWRQRFQATRHCHPFIIHASEGTDDSASKEIRILKDAGVLTSSTVLVHGVGIGRKELGTVIDAQCSLVWCPSSNHFTLGRSLDHEVLDAGIHIALGTDSALTNHGDLLDELRFANAVISPERLYAMVTTAAAQILKLPPGFGKICNNGPADLLIVRDSGLTPAETLLQASPQAVVVRGRFELVSAAFPLEHLDGVFVGRSLLKVEKRGSYLLRLPIASLVKETREKLGGELQLAGKSIS